MRNDVSLQLVYKAPKAFLVIEEMYGVAHEGIGFYFLKQTFFPLFYQLIGLVPVLRGAAGVSGDAFALNKAKIRANLFVEICGYLLHRVRVVARKAHSAKRLYIRYVRMVYLTVPYCAGCLMAGVLAGFTRSRAQLAYACRVDPVAQIVCFAQKHINHKPCSVSPVVFAVGVLAVFIRQYENTVIYA